ncbi:hypothetical protein AB4370_07960 [Vibrio cyclitrophicus]
MNEVIFNIFYFVCEDQQSIIELGAVAHTRTGSDEEKINFLQKNIHSDSITCTRYNIPKSLSDSDGKLSMAKFNGMIRLGRSIELFEDIFKQHKAPINVLYVSTPVVDHPHTISNQIMVLSIYLTTKVIPN